MGLFHAATLSGFKNLAGSFGKGAETSTAKAMGREAGVLGKAALLCVSPLLVPLNLAAHGAAWTVKGYRGAFRKAPGLTGLATAAVVIPTALLTINARKNKDHNVEDMREIDMAQGQTGQVLGMLQATEPAMPQPAPIMQASPMLLAQPNDATPQINSAVYEGAALDPRSQSAIIG